MQSTLRITLFLVAFTLLLSQSSSQQFYKKVVHNTDPEARCLDGTSAFLYVHEGTEKDKFLLYLIGGGFCGSTTLAATLENCYKRSKTELGSSTFWPDFFTDEMGAQGLISLKQPLYQNWTKVLFGYCDGAMMQGGNDSPIPYKGVNLYFRGNKIMRSHFKWLINTYQMDKASKIMLTGGSAGGLASIMWGNYLQTIVENPSSVYVIPDSGIFINSTTYDTKIPLIEQQIATLMTLAHVSQKSPIAQCNAANPGQQAKCLFIEQNHKYLKGKYLFINSQYDQWAISNILRIPCLQRGKSGYTLSNCTSQQMSAIEDYRARYMLFLTGTLQKNANWGMWSIACSQHVYQVYQNMYDVGEQRVPMNTGKTVKDAMKNFIIDDKIEWTVDAQPWPSNRPCAY